ncbi:Retrovirus-related Pol polyprotein from transposon RE2 [Sesamum angolense]|uniref:Retrovirus-related Pol polyprotein from transposon RE2 n=1 Tax=Sesamum angolense TaxID=2727404 RepID=A0AAE1T6D0_9LAMI|nr:Retrovirus-related Pol polyprotein from transposon RE2 [Sesamum angolense]
MNSVEVWHSSVAAMLQRQKTQGKAVDNQYQVLQLHGLDHPSMIFATADQATFTKLIQFLMGLSGTFHHFHDQLLVMYPVQTVNKDYSMVLRVEKQREVNVDCTNTMDNAAMQEALLQELVSLMKGEGHHAQIQEDPLRLEHPSLSVLKHVPDVKSIDTSITCMEPRSYLKASKDARWVNAMNEELTALDKNETWELASLPPLVTKGYNQVEGIDYFDSFSPVAKSVTAKPNSTPFPPRLKLTAGDGSLLPDPTPYRRLVGLLLYLGFIRPNILFAVQQLSQFLHHPRSSHWDAALHVLCEGSGSAREARWKHEKSKIGKTWNN